ncbi:xylulokinase [Phycicoccus endophyticus]|uniref:Xylulose kinase n=1 Tax=Phycicoccus endophyticus TaxID=1690220 RepID=A0A7G9R0E0_9MICO|nr:xylulokinase [Phycicoccus endophyticus]NHI20120.1 xylulokinase [Phycicoccus endophyticus]QNN49065.1 xylulokinase [Phycicoccus endophyticus]GGL38225.1 xylulokinase [Phycicoccus endophyticus]
MTDRPLVAGVDTSTQSCKVAVCDAETGEVVRMGRGSHPDATEVDPAHWWSAWEEATADGLLEGVAALAVGGQQHGMVLLDDADEVVRPALLWNDTRSAGTARDLVAELGGPQAWADAVGIVPLAAITAAKLRWVRDEEPESMQRAARVVLPHDWLTGRILAAGGGFTEWTTDAGDASGTGYFSAATREYRPDLLRLAAGRDLGVPRVAGPAEIVGRTREGLALAAGTGDNMGAALGLGLRRGDVVVSLGTSGTAFARHDHPTADARGFVQSFADAENGFLPLVCTLNAARVLTAGAAMLGVDLPGLDRLALAGEPGAGGLTLLPFLDGERTPNLPEATGAIQGLTRANATPENLARAVVEGMLLGLASAVDAVRDAGCHVERVLLIGGAANSAAVQQVAPDLLGAPVAVPAPGEYVAVGAARQAAWALSGAAAAPEWSVPVEATAEPSAPERGAEAKARYAEVLASTYPTSA